jgi:SAM-dependent methyltransferase
MNTVKQERWQAAQVAESEYWDGINVTELLRICAEKPDFLDMIGSSTIQSLFDHKEILEIGVGPLGISLASFYPEKHKIKHLVKVEPLPQILLTETLVMQQTWARQFVEWLYSISKEGDYVQKPGEQLDYYNAFDTVIIYNVLDHVKDPLSILCNAYDALRKDGKVLVGVDCRSVVGRIKFEYVLRRTAKDEILVKAHPHTFLPKHVVGMLEKARFTNIQIISIPSLIRQFVGSSFRPAFIATK